MNVQRPVNARRGADVQDLGAAHHCGSVCCSIKTNKRAAALVSAGDDERSAAADSGFRISHPVGPGQPHKQGHAHPPGRVSAEHTHTRTHTHSTRLHEDKVIMVKLRKSSSLSSGSPGFLSISGGRKTSLVDVDFPGGSCRLLF